jgi:hypothetical protein
MRQASAFAGAENVFRSAQADRRPKASRGRIHSAHPAPGVGLRRRKRRSSVGAGRPSAEGLRRLNSFGAPRARRRPSPAQRAFFGRRRPTVGRRPQEAEFIRRTPRRASVFADAESVFRSAQADRWPKASGGRIHSAHPAPGVGLRRRKGCFPVGVGRPLAEGLSRSNSFDPHRLTIASPHPPSPPIPEPYRRCRRCPRAAPRLSPGLRSLPDAPAGGGGA